MVVGPVRSLTLARQIPSVALGDMTLAHPVWSTAPEVRRDIGRKPGVGSGEWRDPSPCAVADEAVAVLPLVLARTLGSEHPGVAPLDVSPAQPVRRTAPKRGRNVVWVIGVGAIRRDPARGTIADVAVIVVPV